MVETVQAAQETEEAEQTAQAAAAVMDQVKEVDVGLADADAVAVAIPAEAVVEATAQEKAAQAEVKGVMGVMRLIGVSAEQGMVADSARHLL